MFFLSLVIERKSPDDRKSTNEIHQRKRYSDECLSTCLKLTYARQLHFCVQFNPQAKLCVYPKHDGSECNRMSKLSLIPININDMVHTVCINTARIQCEYSANTLGWVCVRQCKFKVGYVFRFVYYEYLNIEIENDIL